MNGVRSEWTLANNKNNELCRQVFGDDLDKVPKDVYRRNLDTNSAAEEAFLKRKEAGLGLSDRVWNYTDQFKEEIEMGLDLGIRSGASAEQMSRELRGYLKNPDKLFRRVRDEHGQLQLSKNAKAYHPGQGVYRSSYKNALRLTGTETNIAYRTADYLRWQQMDSVVGIEVRLSNNHTIKDAKGKLRPLTDICDTLAGKYPKDFKFVGWHPQCRCHAVPIMKTQEEIIEDAKRILAGKKPLPPSSSKNYVKEPHEGFSKWAKDNAERIEAARGRDKLPYFVRDNDKYFGGQTIEERAAIRHNARTAEKEQELREYWANKRAEGDERRKYDTSLRGRASTVLDIAAKNGYASLGVDTAALEAAMKSGDIALIGEQTRQLVSKMQAIKKTIIKGARETIDIASDFGEVDATALKNALKTRQLTSIKQETKALSSVIAATMSQEEALKDLIPNAHLLHKTYSIKELKRVHKELKDVMSRWLSKYGYTSLDNSPLEHLKNKLNFEISSPSVNYANKEIIKNALTEKIRIIDRKIEWNDLVQKVVPLKSFKTKSTNFKGVLTKIDEALQNNDLDALKQSIAEAERQMQKLIDNQLKKGGDIKTALNKEYKGGATGKDITAGFDGSTMKSADPFRGTFTANAAQMQGFDAPAKLVSEQEFKVLEKDCGEVFYRTVNPTTFRGKKMSGKEFASQIYRADSLEMNGDGGRAYGDGIYVATSSWNGVKLMPISDVRKHSTFSESANYGDVGICETLEMTWTRKPKIIKQDDLKDMWDKLTPEQKAKYNSINNGRPWNTYGCALGYDGMYCHNVNYMVIWNRSIIAVKNK